ncbi:MAG: hypothetical protein R3C01_05905 [Planctomycetaceae bacterium]
MSVALDIGTSGFRSLRRHEGRLFGRQCPAVYVSLANGKAQRRLLEQADVTFSLCDDALIVTGSHALDVSESLNLPTIPLLPEGQLPTQDPLSRQVAAALIDAILPVAMQSGVTTNTGTTNTASPICTLIVPGNPQSEGSPELEFFARLVRLKGYDPVILSAGHAIALAELGRESFTGVGISLGATFSSICLTHRGQVLSEATLPVGTNGIDQAIAQRLNRFLWDAAGNRYFDLFAAKSLREKLRLPVPANANDDWRLTSQLIDNSITTIGRELGRMLTRQKHLTTTDSGPLPVVLSGGLTRSVGFEEFVQSRWQQLPGLQSLGTMRIANDSVWTAARGCLIAAEVEATPAPISRAA